MKRQVYYPTLEIDKVLRTSLYVSYDFPDNMTGADFECLLDKARNNNKKLHKLYGDFLDLNPHLYKLFERSQNNWYVINGCTSGYLYRDIKYFAHDMDGDGYSKLPGQYYQKVMPVMDKLREISNYHGGYLPSPDSLDEIMSAMPV